MREMDSKKLQISSKLLNSNNIVGESLRIIKKRYYKLIS